jgi:hypothetical protein
MKPKLVYIEAENGGEKSTPRFLYVVSGQLFFKQLTTDHKPFLNSSMDY